ncbi:MULTISPECIES: copper resistance protein CopC [Burkholderia]|uniref:copper resistance CopC family protein n=1 Tax=Burkholderia TaxID=32008 RepID=UPI001FC880E4|nr:MULTISPECIES: copper resistance protein CopC [Burkholderia]
MRVLIGSIDQNAHLFLNDVTPTKLDKSLFPEYEIQLTNATIDWPPARLRCGPRQLAEFRTYRRPFMIVKNSIMNVLVVRILVGVVALVCAHLAHAHIHPVHQFPSGSAAVSVGTKDVTIDFDERLEPAFSSVTVMDAHGVSMNSGQAVVDSANPKRISAQLKPLAMGRYTVMWVAVAADGHHRQGQYTFTVK